MQDHIFRKYDIRGVVGQELLVNEVYTFGRALAAYLVDRAKPQDLRTVAVAMDGRVHSAAIRDELVRAFIESGLNVCFVGVCPTPVLYFGMHTCAYDAGVMITASHNEKEYNGFKICYGTELIDAHEILELRTLYQQHLQIHTTQQGTFSEYPLVDQYISWLEQAFDHMKGSTINAVIDCGNGAAAAVVPQLVKRMGWPNVTVLYETVDGNFPNRCPDPTKPHALKELARQVAVKKAACGIAFDGDADRMVGMTEFGVTLSGDTLLAVFAQEMVKNNPGASVAFDCKCSQVLSTLLTQWGAKYSITPTGHAFVKEKMVETHALLAGELSCHFMFGDRYFGYDDGVYAMMRLLEIIHTTQKTVYSLIATFPQSYTTGELRIPCQEQAKQAIIDSVHAAFSDTSDIEISTLDGVRIQTAYGWGIIRASNTQPVMSFSCEAMTPEGLKKITNDFYQALGASFNNSYLNHAEFVKVVGEVCV